MAGRFWVLRFEGYGLQGLPAGMDAFQRAQLLDN